MQLHNSTLASAQRGGSLLFMELRFPFFTASLSSVFLGGIMAWSLANKLDLVNFLIIAVGAACLHGGSNVINDYFDYVSGCDQVNKEAIAPFTGGSGLLKSGALSPRTVLAFSLVLFAIAGGVGAYFTILRGLFIIVLAAFGILSGLLYTSNLATRGIGEAIVGLNFGPLLTLGTYYALTGTTAIEPVFAGLPLGILVAAILWINEIPDSKADQMVGKNTAVVRMGRRRGAQAYAFVVLSSYVSIIAGIMFRILPVTSSLAILTLPLATRAMKVAGKQYDSQELKPANAMTITVHLVTGILLIAAYVLQRIIIPI